MKLPYIKSLIIVTAALLLGPVAGALSQDPDWPEVSDGAILKLDVGTPSASPYLGFGWSMNEGSADQPFRWIRELEADIVFTVAQPADAELWVHAQPLYLNWKQQKVGVYLNGRYMGSWEYPLEPGYRTHRLALSANAFVAGQNRMTLRMGYRSRFKYDSRELALGVDKLLILEQAP